MEPLRVKDLIARLQEMDPEAIVVSPSSNFELNGSIVEARVSQYKGKRKTEGFRDAFDGISYSKEVYRMAFGEDLESAINLVQISG
jgi:hypothetical protein